MSADLPRVLPVEHTADVAELRAVSAVSRNSGVVVGRDALGNVFVTGDGNTVEVKLTVLVADTRLQALDPATLQNPYRGLDAFRETDSAMFFGRDDLIRRLWTKFHGLQRGQAPRLLPIVGASGSGKSSLVRAGLFPELVRQPMEGMRNPTVLVLRPGANPSQRLADVLARLTPDDHRHADPVARGPSSDALDTVHRAAKGLGGTEPHVILFVDQLEELFTECTSETARSAFLATLAHAASQPDGVVSVVFAMRNDFTGSLRAYSSFALAVREQRLTVSQMSRDQLVDTIEQPAKVLGYPWPSGLVENVVLQCEGRTGALPLLQFALKRLWSEHLAGRLAESRWSSQLIEDFVVQVADTLFEGGGAGRDRQAHQRIIQRAFVAMVQLGEGTSDTRRVARLSEIVARGETDEQVRAVLTPFVAPEARLVTASELDGEPTYELAHEALIGSWDRLREWLGHVARQVDAVVIRNDVRLRRRLRHAAEVWHIERTALWRPPELALVQGLRDRDPEELSTLEHEFIDASFAAWQAHERWRRRVRAAGIGASAVFVVAVSILGLVAWRQSMEAQREKAEAERQGMEARREKTEAERQAREVRQRLSMGYMEQGRTLLMDEPSHPLRAIPYLAAARTEATANPVLRTLFAQAARNLPLVTFVGHTAGVNAAAFSADGTRVITASNDGTARVWDPTKGTQVTPPLRHDGAVYAAAFSADGTRVITASADKTARVWNAATGQLVTSLPHDGQVVAAAFSADGTRVITASADKTARVWDAATGQLLERRGTLRDAVFITGSSLMIPASWHRAVQVWNVTTGQGVIPPFEHYRVRHPAIPTSYGMGVVTMSAPKTYVEDAVTNIGVFAPLEHHGTVSATVFSARGTRVVTASGDNAARVWDVATGKPVTPLLEHHDAVIAAAFSADGTRVVTASADHMARVWDAATGEPLTPSLEHHDTVTAAAFSPDGERVITASEDKTARVWAATDAVSMPFKHNDTVYTAAFSADGKRVVTASEDKTARVWNAATGEPITPPLGHRGAVRAAAFSADGTRVVTASEDKTARVWDAATGEPITPPLEHRETVFAAAFSADGARVVTVSEDRAARIWDATTGEPMPRPLEHEGDITTAVFSADGTRVVTASWDGTARVWNAATGVPVTPPLEHEGAVFAATFSEDGGRVITASADDPVRIWNAATGEPVTPPLHHRVYIYNAAFSANGRRVVTASSDGTAQVWNVWTGEPVTLPFEHGSISRAAFSPDGTLVVTASMGRMVQVWDATTGKLVAVLDRQGIVLDAEFSPDGRRVITASLGDRARVWTLFGDLGSIDDWHHLARCSPFAFSDNVPIANPDPLAVCTTVAGSVTPR